jgi:predicted nucleic acid-binding protein
MENNLFIAHHTKCAGCSLKAQELLRKNQIFFVKVLNETCTVLKVKGEDLRKAKQLINSM